MKSLIRMIGVMVLIGPLCACNSLPRNGSDGMDGLGVSSGLKNVLNQKKT